MLLAPTTPVRVHRRASGVNHPGFFEIFVNGERIAVHMRSSGNGKQTTAADHMPSSHRRYADWTIGRVRRDAALIGPATAAICDLILEQRPHPE
jgi:transposase